MIQNINWTSFASVHILFSRNESHVILQYCLARLSTSETIRRYFMRFAMIVRTLQTTAAPISYFPMVSSKWLNHTPVKWRSHWQHLTRHLEVMYGSKATKNMQILSNDSIVNYELSTYGLCENFHLTLFDTDN